jgi:hypothetical protein
LAAAGPALEERLQQQYRSWECQADRGCASLRVVEKDVDLGQHLPKGAA